MTSPLEPLQKHHRRITIFIVLLLLVALGFFVFLFLYFYLGDDLALELRTNQTSFRIRNTEKAPVLATVYTQGQLFCRTECTLALLDANSRSVDVEQFELRSGESYSKLFELEPGRIGTGQSVYSVVASCRNVKAPMCPTLAPEWRKTQLVTVNYALDVEEERLKPMLEQYLQSMLAELREIDLALQAMAQVTAEHPELRAGHLTSNISRLQEGFAQHNLFLENAKLLWGEQSFIPLAGMVAESNTTNESMRLLRDEATGVYAELLLLPQAHNDLRQRIIVARNDLQSVLSFHEPLMADPAVAPMVNDTLSAARILGERYSGASFSSYGNFSNDIADVERNISLLNQSLLERRLAVIALGNAILIEECNCSGTNGTNTANSTNTTNATNPTGFTNATSIAGVCASIVNATYRAAYCGPHAVPQVDASPLAPIVVQPPEVNSSINVTLPTHAPQCCVFGECRQCCSTCTDDEDTYPVIFVHGHSFNSFNSPEYSLGGYFSKIQQRLQEEGYVDAGIITPSSTLSEVDPGEWGVSGRPVAVRATYYYNFYRNGTDYVIITQKSENIETYAIRLNEIIKIVQHHTGKKKVKIVAHSMGGLVVRRYMQLFGDASVEKVILIGTPNHGITARTSTLCPVFGESKECEDMAKGSVFLAKLNDPENRPDVEIVTITGHGCPLDGRDADGIVEASSVALNGRNYDINGTCTDFFKTDLHTEMLNIDKHPQVYTIIRDELK